MTKFCNCFVCSLFFITAPGTELVHSRINLTASEHVMKIMFSCVMAEQIGPLSQKGTNNGKDILKN